MKLSARDAAAFLARPDPAVAAVLLHGPDAMRIALRRKALLTAMIGEGAEDEMRLERIAAADLRKDGALLLDALKAQGFFPGPRAVLLEDAGDGLTETLKAALTDWSEGDARLVITAGQLPPKSKLRKLFEAARTAVAIGIYADPPSRDEIEAAIARAGLPTPSRDASEALFALAQTLDPGDVAQTLEKIALYKHGDDTPLTAEEVSALAPASTEAALDDLINVVAEGRSGDIGPLMRRLAAQGATPVSLCIATARHFRLLYTAMADPAGPQAGVGKLRPPVFGPRRDRLVGQTRRWTTPRVEKALHMLVDTDLALRSSTEAPQGAVLERTLVRLARLGGR